MRLLCASLESNLNGIQTEIHISVDEMSRIVEQITTAAAADMKASQFNVPFCILKLLSAVKFSVKDNERKDHGGAPSNEELEGRITVGETSTSAAVAAATVMVFKRTSMAINFLPGRLAQSGSRSQYNEIALEHASSTDATKSRNDAVSENVHSAGLVKSLTLDRNPPINSMRKPVRDPPRFPNRLMGRRRASEHRWGNWFWRSARSEEFETKSAEIAASASSLKKRPTVKQNAGASAPEKAPEIHPVPALPVRQDVMCPNAQEKNDIAKEPAPVDSHNAMGPSHSMGRFASPQKQTISDAQLGVI
ncbi:hypothetical protein BJ742DRAFT_741531 [Cladochytrium replicatum]|nr:hypothetical protein BJ742DRAFT_741531 [Cladochytrium replicatum]